MTPSQDTTTIQPAAEPTDAEELEEMFEEIDLFSTALIQGGCTDSVAY